MIISETEFEQTALEIAKLKKCETKSCLGRQITQAKKDLRRLGINTPSMTIGDTIKFLEIYNKWRRGDDNYEQPNPTKLGIAIEHAIYYLNKVV